MPDTGNAPALQPQSQLVGEHLPHTRMRQPASNAVLHVLPLQVVTDWQSLSWICAIPAFAGSALTHVPYSGGCPLQSASARWALAPSMISTSATAPASASSRLRARSRAGSWGES